MTTENTTYFCADAAKLPLVDDSVDLILTSPPYNAGLPYPGVCDLLCWSDYYNNCGRWAAEMFRVAAPAAHAVINVAFNIRPKQYTERKPSIRKIHPEPISLRWIEIMQKNGWSYRGNHIWLKSDAPENVVRHQPRQGVDRTPAIMNTAELVIVFFNGEKQEGKKPRYKPEYVKDASLRRLDSSQLWAIPESRDQYDRRWHPCPLPVELVRRAVRRYSYPGEIVLDPFCGTGVVPVVANEMNRCGIGCDLSFKTLENVKRGVKRAPIKPRTRQLKLFVNNA